MRQEQKRRRPDSGQTGLNWTAYPERSRSMGIESGACTDDRLANARAVIETIRAVDSACNWLAASVRRGRGANDTWMLVPLVLHFSVHAG